ncbi:DUF3052 family protein [Glaciibacter sp. 2TAF33]|uniref:DUF3052 family protein n=1 Tax=Glaciibacter sp. 2TAF33 TaxID=3233015 RepID=UPI003F93B577
MVVPATGYSGTPLWKKLGLKPATTAHLVHAPAGWSVPDAPTDIRWLTGETDAPASVIVAFFPEPARFLSELARLGARIRPAGMLWVAWPRKATGHESAMTENLIRDAALELGLVDVKVAALDEAWSGLKLVWRTKLR